MIISHKHRYVFVESPNTGSTAIRQELCQHYDGEPILRRHAYYHEFLNIATSEEQQYFIFSSIRNPPDVAVSLYLKYKTNHQKRYTNEKLHSNNGGEMPSRYIRKFAFIQDNNADFRSFFKRYYKLPYDNWSRLAHKNFDFVIRYENIQDDFRKVLDLLNLTPVRPLPVVNKTSEKKDDYWSYYTPDLHNRARWVFGCYMQQWGYHFPESWGHQKISWSNRWLYQGLGLAKTHLLWKSSAHAHWGERMLETLSRRLVPRYKSS